MMSKFRMQCLTKRSSFSPRSQRTPPERLSAVERAEYVRDAEILGDLMYRSDDYFAVGCTDTEKELDDHLEKWVKSEGVVCDKDPASDPNNLLMWLETLHPLKK